MKNNLATKQDIESLKKSLEDQKNELLEKLVDKETYQRDLANLVDKETFERALANLVDKKTFEQALANLVDKETFEQTVANLVDKETFEQTVANLVDKETFEQAQANLVDKETYKKNLSKLVTREEHRWEISQLRADLQKTDQKINKILEIVDGLAKLITNGQVEKAAAEATFQRHEQLLEDHEQRIRHLEQVQL